MPMLEFKPAAPLGTGVDGVQYSDKRYDPILGQEGKTRAVPPPGKRPVIPCTVARSPVPPELSGSVPVPPELWGETFDAMQQRLWEAYPVHHYCRSWECLLCLFIPLGTIYICCNLGAREAKRQAEQEEKWADFQKEQQRKYAPYDVDVQLLKGLPFMFAENGSIDEAKGVKRITIGLKFQSANTPEIGRGAGLGGEVAMAPITAVATIVGVGGGVLPILPPQQQEMRRSEETPLQKLQMLQELREAGALSEEEFLEKKTQLLKLI